MFVRGLQSPSAAVLAHPAADESEVARETEEELDQALEVFLAQRTVLLRIAYRIVGDAVGAEDVVQDAWLRWQRTDRAAIKNPAAFLTTTTVHLAINVIQSARHRHETTTESLLAHLIDPAQDPTSRAEQAAEVEQILRLLLVRLTPAELAAYVLRKGFDYPYGEIAPLLRTSIPNARQLVRRAQTGIASDRSRPVDPDAHDRLVEAFLAATRTGELRTLEGLLGEYGRRSSRCAASVNPASAKHWERRSA
jgi:RNA polymerase sigma factor (sigma-70 family)